MGLLSKIIPFYGAIESIVNSAGDAMREDQRRRTIRTEAEMKVYLQTEVKKHISRIEEAERSAAHAREIEILREEHQRSVERLRVEAELADMPDRLRHVRMIAYNEHRVALYERVKRLELEIHQSISSFHISQQQQLMDWQRNFTRTLELERIELIENRLPAMLFAAERFRENDTVYEQYIPRVLRVVDDAIESIAADQKMFREQLRLLASEPEKFTEALIAMQRRLEITGPASRE